MFCFLNKLGYFHNSSLPFSKSRDDHGLYFCNISMKKGHLGCLWVDRFSKKIDKFEIFEKDVI